MFQQGQVTVDDRFVRFGTKSYAINKITSVDVRETIVKGSTGYVWFWVIGAIFAIAWLSQRTSGPLIIAIACGVFGYISWTRRGSATIYRLFLMTAASEAQAYETTDASEMMGLRDAIEEAMARS